MRFIYKPDVLAVIHSQLFNICSNIPLTLSRNSNKYRRQHQHKEQKSRWSHVSALQPEDLHHSDQAEERENKEKTWGRGSCEHAL